MGWQWQVSFVFFLHFIFSDKAFNFPESQNLYFYKKDDTTLLTAEM